MSTLGWTRLGYTLPDEETLRRQVCARLADEFRRGEIVELRRPAERLFRAAITVGRTRTPEGWEVSTVLLPAPHYWGSDRDTPTHWYETLLLGSPADRAPCELHRCYAGAVAGHRRWCERAAQIVAAATAKGGQ